MLEATRPASATATFESRSAATDGWSSARGSRSSHRKRRGIFHRTGIVLPAFVVAVVLVAAVAVGAKVMSRAGSGANSLAEAIDSLPHSGSVAMLEQERQLLIVMNAAAKTLTVASKPVMVNPSQVIAAQSDSASSSSDSEGITSISAPPPDPGTAQEIGYEMLPSFGFSQQTQWGCLLDLWNRESGWVYDAENASGAYGIPQALPGSKMASAGPDWQTDPTTQIKWGLGYIKQVYGTPCAAWNFELANNYY